MICKRIRPAAAIERYVKEYMLLHVVADSGITMPVKSYPVNPEEGITLVLRGSGG